MANIKKQVRARLAFKPGFTVDGFDYLDVTETFNMTERKFLNRDGDMQVEDEDGKRFRISKELIAYIKEVQVIKQVVEVKES